MTSTVDERRTPPGSPKRPPLSQAFQTSTTATLASKRRSSGFVYPTIGSSGTSASRMVFYDEESGVLTSDEPLSQRNTLNNSKLNGKLPNQLMKAKDDLEKAKATLNNKDRQLDALKLLLEQTKTEATRRASQARLYRESDATLRKELADAEGEIKRLADDLGVANQEKTRLVALLQEAQQELIQLNEQLVGLRNENRDFKAAIDEHIQLVARLSAELNRVSEKLTSANRVHDEDKAKLSALEHEKFSLLARVDALEATILAQSKALQMNANGFSEVLVQVALPGTGNGEFLVRLNYDDPKQVAEKFAIRNRLSKEATRLLIAFTIAECKA
jgi:hypothetical protein